MSADRLIACFIFDGPEVPQSSLPSPAVVRSLDPGRDGYEGPDV